MTMVNEAEQRLQSVLSQAREAAQREREKTDTMWQGRLEAAITEICSSTDLVKSGESEVMQRLQQELITLRKQASSQLRLESEARYKETAALHRMLQEEQLARAAWNAHESSWNSELEVLSKRIESNSAIFERMEAWQLETENKLETQICQSELGHNGLMKVLREAQEGHRQHLDKLNQIQQERVTSHRKHVDQFCKELKKKLSNDMAITSAKTDSTRFRL